MTPKRVRIGVIVPSSNTIMEPVINEILADISQSSQYHISAYYTRVRVTQIADNADTASQFHLEPMLHAASLLADAKVDVIVWGGTSAGWLGLNTDIALCEAIESRFGIPANSSTLALVNLIPRIYPGDGRVALITPYKAELNQAIRQNFATSNITVAPYDAYLGITDNHAIAQVNAAQLTGMVDEVLSKDPTLNVLTVYCTNLGGATMAREWEIRYKDRNLVVLDSVSTTVYGALKRAGVKMQGLVNPPAWGQVLDVEY